MRRNKMKLVGLFAAITVLPNLAQSGMIDDQQNGWNRDNVDVFVTVDPEADPVVWTLDNSTTTSPSDWPTPYLGYESRIFDSTARPGDNTTELTGTHLATLVAKNPPVGEKPGVKIINNDDKVKDPNKPQNCIMSTAYLEERTDGTGSGFLDADPEQVICSSPFQTHKRYKVGMLPAMVTTIDGDRFGSGVDMVFDVIPGPETSYQVFQKINNWTDSRLDGFKIEIGTGVGTGFVKAGSSSLKVSVPDEIWTSSQQLANFSSGLFSAPDNHFPVGGYFDNSNRAGFYIDEYATQDSVGFADTLTATTILPSNYPDVPTGGGIYGQFGDWLPNKWLPTGIFYDDDHDPDTDNELVAWWGFNPNPTVLDYGWMTGIALGFAEITTDQIDEWAANEWYSAGVIDDLVNVGLNYIVTIPDAYDSGSFTIRITPRKAADQTEPGFVVNVPPPFIPSSEGTVTVSPSPEFNVGESLTITVSDGNATVIPVSVKNLSTMEVENSTDSVVPGLFDMIEIGEDRGIFQGALSTSSDVSDITDNDGIMFATPGDVLEVTYTDSVDLSPDPVTTTAYVTTFFVIPLPGGGASVFDL